MHAFTQCVSSIDSREARKKRAANSGRNQIAKVLMSVPTATSSHGTPDRIAVTGLSCRRISNEEGLELIQPLSFGIPSLIAIECTVAATSFRCRGRTGTFARSGRQDQQWAHRRDGDKALREGTRALEKRFLKGAEARS
jgi:hypothetical protein